MQCFIVLQCPTMSNISMQVVRNHIFFYTNLQVCSVLSKYSSLGDVLQADRPRDFIEFLQLGPDCQETQLHVIDC